MAEIAHGIYLFINSFALIDMATIHTMLLRFQSIDLEAQVPIIIENTAGEAIALNQRTLYTKGVDKNDVPLAPYFSPAYQRQKASENPNNVTDLHLTGAWYGGMYLKITQTTFDIGSTDSKDAMLRDKYGDEITGLDAESKIEYGNTVVLPAIINYLKLVTKL